MNLVKLNEFPQARFRLLPALSEDQLGHSGFALGGFPYHKGCEDPCRNPECSAHQSAKELEMLAEISDIHIKGYDHDYLWHDYEGGFFQFWFCRACETIITFNRL